MATTPAPTTPTRVCENFRNWKDKDMTTCGLLEVYGTCKDGKLGIGVTKEDADKLVAGTSSAPAYEACCACGGGQAAGGSRARTAAIPRARTHARTHSHALNRTL